jgi:hypothetical protein
MKIPVCDYCRAECKSVVARYRRRVRDSEGRKRWIDACEEHRARLSLQEPEEVLVGLPPEHAKPEGGLIVNWARPDLQTQKVCVEVVSR